MESVMEWGQWISNNQEHTKSYQPSFQFLIFIFDSKPILFVCRNWKHNDQRSCFYDLLSVCMCICVCATNDDKVQLKEKKCLHWMSVPFLVTTTWVSNGTIAVFNLQAVTWNIKQKKSILSNYKYTSILSTCSNNF